MSKRIKVFIKRLDEMQKLEELKRSWLGRWARVMRTAAR
jgi:hypothetical protein